MILQTDNPIRMVRELKGAPLSIVMVLSLVTQRVSQEYLERATGYTDKPVSQALAYLREVGLADHIGRAQGLTLNTLMLTEAAATGTSVSVGTTSAISVGDPEKFAYHATTGYYLDDAGSIAWVMRPPTFGAIKNLTGSSRLYDDQTGRGGTRSLLEYPVYYSNAAAAIGSGAISLYFGNWRYMGYRLDPALRFIRDPYTTDGVINLKYSFRACFGVLVAGAIGYGKHPTT